VVTPAGVRSEITVFSLAIDPQNTSTLYGAGFSGVFKSVDGGKSWQLSMAGRSSRARTADRVGVA
jgi:hypothetical protein